MRHQDLLLASDVTYMMYVLYGILLLSVAVSSKHVLQCIIARVYEFGGRVHKRWLWYDFD